MAAEILASLKENLQRYQRDTMHIEGFRAAAVLVPLLNGPDGLELLFTVRSDALSNHAGQVAFPGGRLDAGETIEDAARRETFEEVGLEVASEHLIGYLDDHPSPAEYVVTPVVAVVPWPQHLTLNPAEVAEAFTVPLTDFNTLEPRSEVRQLREFRRRIYYYDWQDKLIWGFTGNVVRNLLEVLKGRQSAEAAGFDGR